MGILFEEHLPAILRVAVDPAAGLIPRFRKSRTESPFFLSESTLNASTLTPTSGYSESATTSAAPATMALFASGIRKDRCFDPVLHEQLKPLGDDRDGLLHDLLRLEPLGREQPVGDILDNRVLGDSDSDTGKVRGRPYRFGLRDRKSGYCG